MADRIPHASALSSLIDKTPATSFRSKSAQSPLRIGQTDIPRHFWTVALLVFPLWLWTLLCVGGFGLAMAIHLGWHPLRRYYSEAFDLLKSRRRLLWIGTLAALGSEWMRSDGFQEIVKRSASEWMDWPCLAVPLAGQAGVHYAILLHRVNATWPAAYLLPLILVAAFWKLQSQPYQCDLRRRHSRTEGMVWSLALASTVGWLASEAIPPLSPQSEWLKSLQLGMRLLTQALLGSGFQVWVLLITIRWREPAHQDRKPDLSRAWLGVVGRWRQVFWLAGFQSIWMVLQHWTALSTTPWVELVLIETLLIFAPLPVAIALSSPQRRFIDVGASAVLALRGSLLGLIGMAITGIAIVAIVHYSGGLLGDMSERDAMTRATFKVLHSFVLAIIHNWLFLASAVFLLDRGFRPPLHSLEPHSQPVSPQPSA